MRVKKTAVAAGSVWCLGVVAAVIVGCSDDEDRVASECFTADAHETTVLIRDYAYDRFRFFDLGLMGDTSMLEPADVIIEFALFQSVSSTQNDVPFARVHADWRDREGSTPIEARFRTVSYANPTEYDIYPEAHYLCFPRWLPQIDNTALAYFMVYMKEDGRIDTVGSIGSDTLDLQLLKVHYPSPTAPLWDAEWRNVYDLRMRDIDYDNLDVRIFKGLPGDESNPANPDHQNGLPYLQLFRIDETDATGTGPPDGRIDDNTMILDLELGLLIFPSHRPFADTEGLASTVPEIYTDNNTQKLREVTKYYMRVTTTQRSAQVRLGRMNVVEGSEVVTLDGDRLTRGVDYEIDYDFGKVTFLRDEALDGDADVVICYHYVVCCP